jgi:Protein of unknown function (DUF2934)
MAKRAARPQARPKTTRAARGPEPAGSNGANGSEGSIEKAGVPHLEAAPNEDDIRVRAYHRYLERGAGDGADFDDWLEAEKDLKVAHN